MLKLNQIRDVAASALLHERLFQSWLYNTPDEDMPHDLANLYWDAAKIKAQATALVSTLNKLHEMLTDFERGDFDKYIDRHTKFIEEGDEAFDPYEDLEYTLITPYCIYAIPETIVQYRELLFFAETHSQRKKNRHNAFNTFFPGLETHYTGMDAEGNTVMIPESEMDGDTLLRLEANREIRHIETEHCLDNYNLWYLKMKRGISERKPFSDLLSLIVLDR